MSLPIRSVKEDEDELTSSIMGKQGIRVNFIIPATSELTSSGVMGGGMRVRSMRSGSSTTWLPVRFFRRLGFSLKRFSSICNKTNSMHFSAQLRTLKMLYTVKKGY
jgi:hypothetical protein